MIRSRGEVRARVRELSAELHEELAMFGIRPHRDAFITRAQLDKALAQISRRFPLSQQVDSNPVYIRWNDAYNRIYRASEKFNQFGRIDGWHSAMFEVLVENRLGGTTLHTEDELVILRQALSLLEINLLDSKVYDTAQSSGDKSNKISILKLSQHWPQVVNEHYQRLASHLKRAELEELKAARDILLRANSNSGLNTLLRRAQYESFYRVLDLDPRLAENYSDKDIKQAHRLMSMQYHPDKNPGDAVAAEKSKNANDAARLLRNKPTRSQIDAFLRQYLQGQGEGS